MNAEKHLKNANNLCFIHFLAALLVVFGIKSQVSIFLKKIENKRGFYGCKNPLNLLIFNILNINQYVRSIICGDKSGSGYKKGGE